MKPKTIEEAQGVINENPYQDDFVCRNYVMFLGRDGEPDDNSIELAAYWTECNEMIKN